MITPERVIQSVCEALELDRDKLTAPKKQGNTNYRDGRLILAHIMRNRIYEDRVVCSSIEGKRCYVEATKHITFKAIAEHLNRTKPQSAMASVLTCIDLLKTDKKFRIKYQSVIELMTKNGYIEIQTQTNG